MDYNCKKMDKRILCLDVGTKKIGVAVSDPFGMTAQGLKTILRKTFRQDCEEIVKIAKDYEAQKIIIGLPLDMEGEEGPQAKKTRFFGEGLREFLRENHAQTPIEFWDESLSSREAEAVLLEADLSRKKRKKVIDKLAAALILESYLQEKEREC